jgi:hypothetical protein
MQEDLKAVWTGDKIFVQLLIVDSGACSRFMQEDG